MLQNNFMVIYKKKQLVNMQKIQMKKTINNNYLGDLKILKKSKKKAFAPQSRVQYFEN